MSNLSFVQLKKEDQERCTVFEAMMVSYSAELDVQSGSQTPPDFLKKWIGSIIGMQGPHDRHLELCYSGNELVGFLYGKVDHPDHRGYIKPGYGYIMEFYVRPEYRRRGFGKEMLRRLEGHFSSHGTERMYLTTDPDSGGLFWEAVGFAATGEVSPENRMPIYEKAVGK